MHLKEARAKGKLHEFISEHEKTRPVAHKKRLHALIKAAALGKSKSKRGTSQRAKTIPGNAIVTVLEIPPVESPETAVKMAIAAKVRGKK